MNLRNSLKNLRFKYTFISILVLLILFNSQVYSQEKEYIFNQLTTDDGLSSTRATCFFEDSLGFMWIGTNNGLNRYDGSSVKTFYTSDESVSIHSIINTFAPVYHSSNFWIGTSSGLYLFDIHTYKASTLPPSIDPQGQMTKSGISDLANDKNGTLWIACSNNVFKYDSTLVNITNNKRIYRNNPLFSTLCISPNNDIIIGSENGLLKYNRKNNKIEQIKNSTAIGYVKKLYKDSDGDLWVGTKENGAYLYKNFNFDSVPIYFSKENGTLMSDFVWDISEYGKNRIVLINKEAGLSIYDKTTQSFEYIKTQINRPYGLSSKAIINLKTDSKKNLWIGSLNNGISYIDNQRKPFKHYNLDFGDKGLFNNNVRSFFEDSEGYIWVGTKENGGLSRFDPKTKTFKHYRSDKANPQSLQDDNITCIGEVDSRYLLIGTFLEGLQVLDRKTGIFKRYLPDPNKPNSISNKYITGIANHPNGKILIATGSGLDMFDFKTRTFKNIFSKKSGRYICVENADSIWLGTQEGLYLLSPTGKIHRMYNRANFLRKRPYALKVNYIASIKMDNDSCIWVGSGQDGLYKMNEDRKGFTHHYDSLSSPVNKLTAMLIDDHNNIWFSSREGLTVYRTASNIFDHYNKLDGLQGNQFEIHAALKTKAGKMLFGGRNGFNIFHPDSIKRNPLPPNVVITELKLFNKPVGVGDENSPLSHHISISKKIVLKHTQSMLTFEYVAISFSSALKNAYAYKMEGVDQEWNYVGNTRTATYASLSPGKYTFKVKASNNDDVWNEDGASIEVIILPPWWQTPWFNLLLVLSFITIVYLLFKWRLNSLERQQKRLKEKVQKRTIELSQKNDLLQKQKEDLNTANTKLEEHQRNIEKQAETLHESNLELQKLNSTKDKFFSIIAHDLRNPISGVLGLNGLLMNKYYSFEDEKRLEYIKIINNSTKTIYELLDNLLNWARSQNTAIALDIQSLSPYHEITTINELVNNALKDKKLEIKINIPEDLIIQSDHNMFKAICRNLITNSIKFSSNGNIDVYTTDSDDAIKITIKDCGTGMSQETIDKILKDDSTYSTQGTKGESGSGIGLVICKEFIAKLKGELKIESTLGVGSSFIITLPKNIS